MILKMIWKGRGLYRGRRRPLLHKFGKNALNTHTSTHTGMHASAHKEILKLINVCVFIFVSGDSSQNKSTYGL